MNLNGIFLPVITPFYKGEVDISSYRHLIKTYMNMGISGIIPLGTTGEVPVLSVKETEMILDVTLETVNSSIPVIAGHGGNHTGQVIEKLNMIHKYPVDGILSVCPYYNRPGQEGLRHHFTRISEATDLDIIIYNIPYRTGVNMTNETLLKLAELKNITGVKDSCGDIMQTLRLISEKPENFSVLTGEDIMFFTNICHGGNGGILASSHLFTNSFVTAYQAIRENDIDLARECWKRVETIIPHLFTEPNPVPLKHCLFHQGLIRSPEVRLPLTNISRTLAKKLNTFF